MPAAILENSACKLNKESDKVIPWTLTVNNWSGFFYAYSNLFSKTKNLVQAAFYLSLQCLKYSLWLYVDLLNFIMHLLGILTL